MYMIYYNMLPREDEVEGGEQGGDGVRRAEADRLLYSTIPYYNILYFTILYYTILYCTIILYYTILYCTILYYTILYYTPAPGTGLA